MNTAVFYSNSNKAIGVGTQGSEDWLDITLPGLIGWDMMTPICPQMGSVFAVQQFHDVQTSDGLLAFDQNSITTATFEATSLPEPATLAVVGADLVGILRRRHEEGLDSSVSQPHAPKSKRGFLRLRL